LNVLLLGGYAFLGRAIIDAAQARGHAVSAFNRGNRATMAGVEQITGDRNALVLPDRRTWDVAIDTSGQAPRHTRGAAEALRDRISHYIYTSSISVYSDPMPVGVNESAPVAQFPPDANREDARDLENYGPRKAACEDALAAVLPAGSILIVRPGFIVGPYDYSDRFNEWIERAARPQPFIVPGDPEAPVQMIDVRDLAEWMIAMAERRASGVFNATGPERPLRAIDVAQTCIDATGSSAVPLVIASEDLKSAGVIPWDHIPFWSEPDEYGSMQVNIDRALTAGLHFRPLIETVSDTYAWLQTSDHPRRITLPPEIEKAAINAARHR
jgi:2'-hydroxyisoflavone reductase